MAFAVSVGGFWVGLGALSLFALTMGVAVFALAILGSTAGPVFTTRLRLWGSKVQAVAEIALILVGGTLIYLGINPGAYGRLLLE